MRRYTAWLYAADRVLAGVFLVGVLVMVMAGVAARLVGVNVRGTDAYAGYCMAAAAFLGLAPTLLSGGHIRVDALLNALSPARRRLMERAGASVALAIAVFLAYYSVRLAWQSYLFGDISQGNDATPLWIPQIAMAFGSVSLAIAFIETLVDARGVAPPPHISLEASPILD